MESFTSSLLPALLSAVAVFIVSSIIHMVLPWHKGDYRRLDQEDAVMDALRPFNIPAGDYMVPRPSGMADMRSPEFAEKLKRGPVVIMTTWPSGSMSMKNNLIGWFVFSFVIAFVAGHLAYGATHGSNPDGRVIFHTVGLAAFLGFAGGLWQMSIWYHRSLGTTIRSTIDGLIYGAITGFIFCWMWT
jgi:hypothetical protein